MSDNRQSEDALIAKVRACDPQALEFVYDKHNDELYRYAWRQLGSEVIAEDCVAETFTSFLNALRQGKGPEKYLRAYLFQIAHNWIVDFYRRQPAVEQPLEDVILSTTEAEQPSGIVAKKMEQQEIQKALAQLTDDQRQVIVLRYLQDWSHEEIAQAMRKPVGAVKALQHRATDALRKILTGREEENDGHKLPR